MLKIVAACGNGMGSSQMIKMKITQVFQALKVPADVQHMAIAEARDPGRQIRRSHLFRSADQPVSRSRAHQDHRPEESAVYAGDRNQGARCRPDQVRGQ